MIDRISRYREYLAEQYFQEFSWPHGSDESKIAPELRNRLSSGDFDTVVFSGMGCSAIVSDLLRAVLATECPSLAIYVFNDYDYRPAVPQAVMDSPRTLVIISSYSGFSTEPLLALATGESRWDRSVVLSSGGPLLEFAEEHGISIIRWQLTNPDREYPLFHVPQYFVILLRLFAELGLINSAAAQRYSQLEGSVRQWRSEVAERAKADATDVIGTSVIMVSTPLLHDGLLKLAKMHLNEISMVPATRNYLHEFCHSEIATLTAPKVPTTLLIFVDPTETDFTRGKRLALVEILESGNTDRECPVVVKTVAAPTKDLGEALMYYLDYVQQLTLELSLTRPIASTDLISRSAGNTYYSSTTILAEMT